jgi:branched-chain amino acid transport system substrate-binding protein
VVLTRRVALLLVGALCSATAACSDGSGGGTAATSTAVPTTVGPIDDGALRIGAVLPRGGTAPDLGGSMRAAVQLAVDEINDSGGVLGKKVSVVVRDEGDDANTALLAVQDLLQIGVDAIVGPTSSVNVLHTLGTAVDGGVLSCSPTASALSLEGFPDNGLFMRTVPSDSLQAEAIAGLVDDSGSSTAVVVYLDDAYGRPFGEAAQDAITARGTRVIGSFGFTATDASINDMVGRVADLGPDMVVVIADGATGPTVVAAIDDAIPSPKPSYVVNDAVRRLDSSVAPFGSFLASRVEGVSPAPVSRSTTFNEALTAVAPDTGGWFAQNAYDCINLIALGAQTSGSTLSTSIAAAIPAVSNGGSSCVSFPQCNEVLANDRNPDYDGPDGVLTIDTDGEVVTALFDHFGFDESGRDVSLGVMEIGST